MLSLKKTALAVLALGISGAASAAMYAPAPAPVCTPGNVTIPCESSAWDLGIQALYLQPLGNANGSYYNQTVNATNTNFMWNDADPDWDWGYRIEGSYHFGTGNDFTLNWTHFDDTNNYAWAVGVAPTGTTNTFWNETKFDQVNFEFGQMVDFGEHVNTRFHSGVTYAKIRNNPMYAMWNTAVPVVQTGFANAYSQFDGWGLRAGADSSYDFGNGFSIFANTAAALLVGDMDWNATRNNVAGIPAASTQTFAASHTQIVPELEAKLGVKYTHAMAQGDLSFEAGYQIMNYFNAQTVVPGVGAVTGAVAGAQSDFGLQGIFLGAKWVGNVA